MKYLLCLIAVVSLQGTVSAQEDTNRVIRNVDSIPSVDLPGAVVTAYGFSRGAYETPTAVSQVDGGVLKHYGDNSILQAISSTPGVRMEERSPGSYRLSIRGSTLRSPFGVRNVKVYYNEIPLTDPGGFTYLNQLGFFNITHIDIMRGPGSSIYGAGTGGVLLLSSATNDSGVNAMYEVGSYGLNHFAAELNFGKYDVKQTVRYEHLNSDGYRQQSFIRRDVASWDGSIRYGSKAIVDVHFLYNKLNYGTPGALTATEFEAKPRAARPATASAPGAVDQQAQVFQQNMLLGFTSTYNITTALQNIATLYGSYTELVNPTIRNYTRSNEPHFGGRTVLKYEVHLSNTKVLLLAGAEAQQGFVLARTYGNNKGTPDTLQSDDETKNRQITGFAQIALQYRKWGLDAGGSIVKMQTNICQFSVPSYRAMRNYGARFSPRVALSFRASSENILYAEAAQGFSPPVSAELLPTGGALNNTLQPETGWDYEIGDRGKIFGGLTYDVTLFYFSLQHTIVLRKDALGGDSYLNAGSTKQLGAEAGLNYRFIPAPHIFAWLSNIWLSYTGYQFHYHDFRQGASDYSGNKMPGVAPNTVACGLDIVTKPGISLNASYFFSDRMALNDANTVYGDPYQVIDLKLGYELAFRKFGLQLFAGIDNLLNQRYSLGYDFNAAGGRYYNAAPGVNYHAGLRVAYR